MRLSHATDHALQALMYLGGSRRELVTIAEIAEAYKISRNHLMKVVYRLGVAGFVHSVRGKGGGLRLAREPSAICIGDVVRSMEESWDLAGCFRSRGSCPIEPRCKLRGILSESLSAFLDTLDRYTLEDILIGSIDLPGVIGTAEKR